LLGSREGYGVIPWKASLSCGRAIWIPLSNGRGGGNDHKLNRERKNSPLFDQEGGEKTDLVLKRRRELHLLPPLHEKERDATETS